MPVLTPMTFRELMAEYGIQRQIELRRRTGLAKQYVSALWNQKLNIGRELGERLSRQLGIPVERLLTLDRVPSRSLRRPGRPRKEPPRPEAGQP